MARKILRTESNRFAADRETTSGRGFGRRLRDLSRLLDRVLTARLAPRGVSLSHYFVFRELWAEEGLTLRELAARVKVSEPSTMVTLDTMARRGWVERRQGESDRRKTHVFLTAAGRALRPKLQADVAAVTAGCYRGVDQRQIESALGLFDEIANNAGRALSARRKGS